MWDLILAKLKEQKIITDEQMAEASKLAEPSDFLIKKCNVSDEQLAIARGLVYGLNYIDTRTCSFTSDILDLIPRDVAENYRVIPCQIEGTHLIVAVEDPTNLKALEAVSFAARQKGYVVDFTIASPTGITDGLKRYQNLTREVEAVVSEAIDVARPAEQAVPEDIKNLQEVVKDAPVSKMVSAMLRHAVESGASDIHVESVEQTTRIRYRLDGELKTVLTLPVAIHPAIVARIKVLSNMKLDETRIPQDGRIRETIGKKTIDFRISTLPVVGNEKVVMRVLDTTSSAMTLDKLGFWGFNLEQINHQIARPHGMLLVTGPTGSGKSTTLFSALSIVNKEDVNIVTLEDPVEYFMAGVNQSQINPDVGLTFASGLRSILRQDPDAIMVGEIRDRETAELAVQAALTGHIVLSTLHTNDAIGAIPRLLDMGVEPFLLAASLNLVLAQRLVRKICPYCREKTELPEAVLKEIQPVMEMVKSKGLLPDKLEWWHGQGCPRCNNIGYKGRTVISEVLADTKEVQNLTVEHANSDKFVEQMRAQGALRLMEDGLIKALRGETTMEEILTSTRE